MGISKEWNRLRRVKKDLDHRSRLKAQRLPIEKLVEKLRARHEEIHLAGKQLTAAQKNAIAQVRFDYAQAQRKVMLEFTQKELDVLNDSKLELQV